MVAYNIKQPGGVCYCQLLLSSVHGRRKSAQRDIVGHTAKPTKWAKLFFSFLVLFSFLIYPRSPSVLFSPCASIYAHGDRTRGSGINPLEFLSIYIFIIYIPVWNSYKISHLRTHILWQCQAMQWLLALHLLPIW